MYLHESESAIETIYISDPSTQELSRSMVAELPRGVSEALSDPIVQALMAADGIDRDLVEGLMHRVIARRARRVRCPS